MSTRGWWGPSQSIAESRRALRSSLEALVLGLANGVRKEEGLR